MRSSVGCYVDGVFLLCGMEAKSLPGPPRLLFFKNYFQSPRLESSLRFRRVQREEECVCWGEKEKNEEPWKLEARRNAHANSECDVAA